jgi:hypothetical protein
MSKTALRISKYKPSAFQGRFDFDAVSKKKISILANEYPTERIVFLALFGFLAILFCAYFYFVSASVLNIIARKEADAQSARMQGSIGSLEEHYFALSQAITPEAAANLGLTPIARTQYVYRPGNAAIAAPTRGNEI